MYLPSVNLEIFKVGFGGEPFMLGPEIWNLGGSGRGAGCLRIGLLTWVTLMAEVGLAVVTCTKLFLNLEAGTILKPLLATGA